MRIISIAFALLATAAAALADEAAMTKRATELREAPGESARSLGALPAQAPVTRLTQRQGPWIQVKTAAGATGWVHLFDVGPATGAGSAGASSTGGGAAGALRSVTSFFTKPSQQRATTSTSTIGIRGLGAGDLAQAQPDTAAVARMEALRQDETQARRFARTASLAAATVEALPAPARAAAAATAPSGTTQQLP